MTAFLRLNALSFNYVGAAPVVSDLSCDLLRGRVTGLLGPSGCGKSTLLRLIAGLERPSKGEISFEHPSPLLSFVSQDPVIFEQYSRLDNARYRQRRGANRSRFREEIFGKLQHALGLNDGMLNSVTPYETMSGGQRQRLVLLRELSVLPDVILLDEPCSGLDAVVKRDFLAALRSVLDEHDVRCLYATHHFDELTLVADEILSFESLQGKPARPQAFGLDEFVSAPPTIRSARTILGPLSSVLQGEVVADSFALTTSGRWELVVAAGAVAFEADGFQTERADIARDARLVNMQGQVLFVLPQGVCRGERLRFNGYGYLFERGQPSGKCLISSLKRNEEWLICLSR